MPYQSLNPVTGQVLGSYPSWSSEQTMAALEKTSAAQRNWALTSINERAELMTGAADRLRAKRDELAALITMEMGKLTREARAEIEKCALACDYYAVHAGPFLAEESIRTDAGRSYVTYLPLGTVLGVMPWNFPFWQVFRFAAPALMAGNACVLKHASNMPQCALAIEAVFRDSGFPEGVFTTLMIDSAQVSDVIASAHVHAVTLTGSEAAGRSVAAAAGQHLKKCVMELGGSDPFVVLRDADLELAAEQAVASRFINCGQSCIAAKRFILVPEIADEFLGLFRERVNALRVGDPSDPNTDLGPMARRELRDELHRQVTDAIAAGALAFAGCQPMPGEGNYYMPSILDRVTPKARAYREEVFGPVALAIRAADESDAIRIANDTAFGLGSSIWSRDYIRAESLSTQIEAGGSFINGIVRSDPRLPFGGVKASGFGRELSYHGLREFTNAKTVWIREPYFGAERRQKRERRQGDRRQGDNVIPMGK
jgi:succinate-semialdehyde dehydrogenase / glutarate-semialdehyde dehydrogenase